MKTRISVSLIFLSSIAFAEPLPWGLMIKKDQCAKFWSGDECIYYKLPAGWKETYPDDKGFINYREKKCKFEAGKEKNCCEQLGLKFVDTKADKDLSQAAPDFCKDR